MALQNVTNLKSKNYAIIDKDTGTVLGTNVVLVFMPRDEAEAEAITSSDSMAFGYAEANGIPVLADVDE